MKPLESNACGATGRTGMAAAVMAEVADRLHALATRGEPGAVDLRSLPLTAADLEEIDERLGRGEVSADIAVAGRSQAWETAWAGVWRVRHYGGEDALAADEICIGPVPDIIPSHPDDINDAADRLRAELDSAETGQAREEAVHG